MFSQGTFCHSLISFAKGWWQYTHWLCGLD